MMRVTVVTTASRSMLISSRCTYRPHFIRLGATPRFLSSLPSTKVDEGKETKGVEGVQLDAAKTVKREESLRSIIRSVMEDGKKKGDKSSSPKKGDKTEEEMGKIDRMSMMRLVSIVKPEAKTLSFAVATLGLTTGISLVFPAAIGQILDVAIAPSTTLSHTTVSLGLLSLFLLQSSLIVVRSALLTGAGERLSAGIRRDLFKVILQQEIGWFDSQRTGDIMNRLSSDSIILQKSLTSNLSNGLRSVFMVGGGIGMLFYLSPSLAALSLSLIPPVSLAGMTYGRYVQGQQKAVQKALGDTMDVAQELISSIRTVRQHARERDEAARFDARVDDSYIRSRRIGIVAAGFDGAVHMAANVSLVAVLWYGGSQVADGSMSAGDLTAFLMYSLYTGFNISNLSNVYTELKRASGAAGRIYEIVDRQSLMPLSKEPADKYFRESSNSDRGNSRTGGVLTKWNERDSSAAQSVLLSSLLQPDHIKGDVEFNGVYFAYPSRKDVLVLKSFSLKVNSGTHLCIVGGSGSGKSTVGALLTRLYDPVFASDGKSIINNITHGDITTLASPSIVLNTNPNANPTASSTKDSGSPGTVMIDGVDIKNLDPQWLRTKISVVSQEPVLFATSILENIRYGKPDATTEECEKAASIANAHNFITNFPDQYGTLVGEKGVQLSGGQRQRVAIARAILRDAPIIIMDEATSALDAQSEALVTDALSVLLKGRTVITIAHRLSTMRKADVIAVLQDGAVVESGGFETLNGNPHSAFRKLIEKQLYRQ